MRCIRLQSDKQWIEVVYDLQMNRIGSRSAGDGERSERTGFSRKCARADHRAGRFRKRHDELVSRNRNSRILAP